MTQKFSPLVAINYQVKDQILRLLKDLVTLNIVECLENSGEEFVLFDEVEEAGEAVVLESCLDQNPEHHDHCLLLPGLFRDYVDYGEEVFYKVSERLISSQYSSIAFIILDILVNVVKRVKDGIIFHFLESTLHQTYQQLHSSPEFASSVEKHRICILKESFQVVIAS